MKKINYKLWVFLFVIFLLTTLIFIYINNSQQNNNYKNKSSIVNIDINDGYKVVRTVDGDTIKVSKIINNKIENKEYTIRMIGVDTPETVDPRKIVQCFGKEASNWTKNKLFDKVIKLEYDESQGERDKYNRLLAYVILDGVNFNKGLIENGYGYEYTYKKSDPYKYQKEFKEAEKYARENKIGLWADGACGEKNVI